LDSLNILLPIGAELSVQLATKVCGTTYSMPHANDPVFRTFQSAKKAAKQSAKKPAITPFSTDTLTGNSNLSTLQ
jgi:hypothetical protein